MSTQTASGSIDAAAIRRPVGFGRLVAAELTFLLRARWPILAAVTAGAVALIVVGGSWGVVGASLEQILGLTSILPLVWASVIWSGERPGERDYFLGAPASQAGHELARVGVGSLFLLATLLLCMAAQEIAGLPIRPGTMGPVYVLGSLTVPLTFYFIVSAVALVSSWPVAWYLGVGSGISLVRIAAGPKASWLWAILGSGRFGLNRAAAVVLGAPTPRAMTEAATMAPYTGPWHAPGWSSWGPAAAVWLGISLAAVLLVAHRRDLRRQQPEVAPLSLP